MSEKVMIPREIAEAIESIWNDYGYEKVIKHMYMNNWTQLSEDTECTPNEEYYDVLRQYGKNNPITYMTALVNGYEVEQPQFKDGDFIYFNNPMCMGGVGEVYTQGSVPCVMWWDGRSCTLEEALKSKYVYEATPEQIRKEKQRRVFANVGREWGEFREGDVIHLSEEGYYTVSDSKTGVNYVSSGLIKELLEDDIIDTIYFANHAVQLNNL